MSNKNLILTTSLLFDCLVTVLHKKPELRKTFDNEEYAKQLLKSAFDEDELVENGLWNKGLIEEFFEKECS